jgi:hypothetical protein
MTVTRRQLKFASFDDVVAEVERLQAGGYDKAGTWDLAQVCDHLAAWATYPVQGFPKPPLPIALMLRLVRATLGRGMYEKYMREGMPAGKPTMPQSVAAPGGDTAAAVERLKAAYARFKAHAGDYLPSPLFGKLTRDEATALQLRHAEHHLGFLVPK